MKQKQNRRNGFESNPTGFYSSPIAINNASLQIFVVFFLPYVDQLNGALLSWNPVFSHHFSFCVRRPPAMDSRRDKSK